MNELREAAERLRGVNDNESFNAVDLVDLWRVAHAYLAENTDANRYRWLRSSGLEHINFRNLTPDTSDVGLDAAIDAEIREAT